MISLIQLLHTTTSVVESKSLNHTKYHWLSAPGIYSLQLSPFWTKASTAPQLWSDKKTWCGWMQKNSITNRAHLHNFHQAILSCQKGLLLIGLEGKRKGGECGGRHGKASWGPLDAHVWLIKVEGDFFSLFLQCSGLQNWPEALAGCDTNKIEKGTWNEQACVRACVSVGLPEVWMHLIILIWDHNTGGDGRCMGINLSLLNIWCGHAVNCCWPDCGFVSCKQKKQKTEVIPRSILALSAADCHPSAAKCQWEQ